MALPVLKSMIAAPGHQFWPDSISLTDSVVIRIPNSPKQITDCYLLALAAANHGKLTTFDLKIDTTLVRNGKESLLTLGRD